MCAKFRAEDSNSTVIDTRRFYSADGAAFEVRAHHAVTPSYLTRPVVATQSRAIASETIAFETSQFLKFANSPHKSNRDEARDYLGKRPAQYAPVYSRKVLAYVAEFIDLKNDALVDIVRTPDGICQACAIGNHYSEPEHDDYLNTFVEVANWLGKVAGSDYTVTSADEALVSMRTTKGDAVEVMLNIENYYDYVIATDPRYEELRGE